MTIGLTVFFARFIDVSLGTMRTYLSVKGKKVYAGMLAFVEALIWFLIVRTALSFTGTGALTLPLFYAGGFSVGTLFGTYITDTLFNAFIRVQIITKKVNDPLIKVLKDAGYAMTIMALQKSTDGVKKEMLIIEIKKKSLKTLTELVEQTGENYFLTINETKYVQNGIIK